MRTAAEAKLRVLQLELAKWLDDELRDRELARMKGCDPADTNQVAVSDALRTSKRNHVSEQHNRLQLAIRGGQEVRKIPFSMVKLLTGASISQIKGVCG